MHEIKHTLLALTTIDLLPRVWSIPNLEREAFPFNIAHARIDKLIYLNQKRKTLYFTSNFKLHKSKIENLQK